MAPKREFSEEASACTEVVKKSRRCIAPARDFSDNVSLNLMESPNTELSTKVSTDGHTRADIMPKSFGIMRTIKYDEKDVQDLTKGCALVDYLQNAALNDSLSTQPCLFFKMIAQEYRLASFKKGDDG